jgi:type IX secretion system PorP/SprF family membrane protein
MNKLFILSMSFCCALNCWAQQKPHYTQYVLNQYVINPALTGIENYVDIKISHRQQWTGINGAPVTTYASVQGPIGKNDYRTTATSFDVTGENPRGQRYWETYTAAEPHHGLGVQVFNDVTGALRNTSIYGTYAYHIGLSPRTSIAAGFGIGASRYSLDASKLDFGPGFSSDPAIASSDVLRKTKADLTAGLYLYSADYFAGFSAQQVIPSKLDFSDNTLTASSGKTVPHLFATVGRRFLIGEDFNLVPSVLLKYVQPLPVQVETNFKLQYQNTLWLGASYRHKDGYAGIFGFNVFNAFNVSYAYDHTTSGLNTYSKGTHEILVGFIIGNKYSDSCPRNVW